VPACLRGTADPLSAKRKEDNAPVSTPTADEVGQFVVDHFRAKSECDREALLEQFAPDVRIWTPLSLTSRNFVERPTVGAGRIADLITSEYFYTKAGREWTVEDWVSDGAKLAVRASLKAIVAATGEAYENSYTFFYRLEGLRIAESWEAFDTAFVTDQVRPQRDAI
jgi:ketosteroid isomerase-like protein